MNSVQNSGNGAKPIFLVTDIVPAGFIESLQRLGFEVEHKPEIDNAALIRVIENYAGIVINTAIILDKPMLARAANLKYILRPGSGMDNIDVEEAESRNIKIFNSPEANSDSVAEHAIG